jgi:hypothetical protein
MNRRNPFAEYEKLGETKVRELLAAGRFGSPTSYNHDKASSWLKLLEDRRTLAAAERAETREEISLSISRKAMEASMEANSIALKARSAARRANTIAIIAMILSVIIAIIANPDKIIWFLQWIGILKP